MPIYDFVCSKCGYAVEEYVSSYKDEVKCEKCGTVMNKKPSATGKPIIN